VSVRVQMFAALREAAGTSETTVSPGSLPALLEELRERFGEPFRSRLKVASVLVDGDPVDPQADVAVGDGSEVALLPPFSGGGPGRTGEAAAAVAVVGA
jgi:molybdopterin converting factor small subunit